MKIIAKALITTIIIFSVAVVAGEQKTRINLVIQAVPEGHIPVLDDVGSYPLSKAGSINFKTSKVSKIASRKKTVSR